MQKCGCTLEVAAVYGGAQGEAQQFGIVRRARGLP
jgi:hypothetical protein